MKPFFTWDSHSLKINDIYVSQTSDRIISASADQTCKVISFLFILFIQEVVLEFNLKSLLKVLEFKQ